MFSRPQPTKKPRAKKPKPPGPISKIPDELLCMVFAYVARYDAPDPKRETHERASADRKRIQRLGVLKLAEVCKRFQLLLHSMAPLWADLVYALPEPYVRNALLRSRTAPLPGRMWGSGWEASLAVTCAARLRSLDVYIVPKSQYQELFARRLPLLESLTITATSYFPLDSICIDAPLLRHFCLRDGWGSSQPVFVSHGPSGALPYRFPALRSLSLSQQHTQATSARSAQLELGWVVDVLQHSPLIEAIKMDLVGALSGDRMDWRAAFDGRNTLLARLRSLELTGSMRTDLGALFKRLCPGTRPERCRVTLLRARCNPRAVGNVELASDEDMAAFLNDFGPLLQHPSYSGMAAFDNDDQRGRNPHPSLATFPALLDPRDYTNRVVNDLPEAFMLTISPPLPDLLDRLAPHLRNAYRQLIIHTSSRGPIRLGPAFVLCAAARELYVEQCWDSGMPVFPVPAAPDVLPMLDTVYVRPTPYRPRKDKIQGWWGLFVEWLEHRAQSGHRVRRVYLRGYKCFMRKREEEEELDRVWYARAEALVDEFVDERKGHLPFPSGTCGDI